MKRGGWWPIAITGALAATVGANTWVMVIASDDPSFAIEPDYYRKALAWDTTMAQAAHNAALGWRITLAMGPIARDGRAIVTARLTDSTGAVIRDAVVHVWALPIARSTAVQQIVLVPDGDGEYAAQFDARRPGQWELRFDAAVGRDRFTQVSRVDVP